MKRIPLTLISLFVLFSSGSIQAQLTGSQGSSNIFDNAPLSTSALQSVLPADSAFNLNAYIEAPNTLILNWEIQDGYYLYRKSLSIESVGENSLLEATVPTGINIHDEFFGDVEVYYQQLLLRIPFDPEKAGNSLTLDLSYQGCAEERYCYPVQSRTITLEIL